MKNWRGGSEQEVAEERGARHDEAVPSFAALGLAIAALVVFGIAERLAPLRPRRRPVARRWVVNAAVALPGVAVSALLVLPSAQQAIDWTSAQHFGLLALVEAPAWLETALAFLLFDLTFYGWHRANHRASWLWRFHVVHHADPDLDVTTAARFHFGEILLSVAFRILQVLLIGPTLAAFVIYEAVFQVAVLFHHSNFGMVPAIDRALTWLVVTPRMHGVHHSQERSQTDSNFGTVLTLWDRLARTFSRALSQEKIVTGVPALDDDADNAVGAMLSAPFRDQPKYWDVYGSCGGK